MRDLSRFRRVSAPIIAALVAVATLGGLALAQQAGDTKASQTKTPPPAAAQTKQGTTKADAKTDTKAGTKAAQPPAAQTKGAAGTKAAPQVEAPQQTKGATGRTGGAGRNPVIRPRDTVLTLPVVIMREVFSYETGGRRDPFLSLLTTNDLRPTLSDLKLSIIMHDAAGQSVAALRDQSAGNKQVMVRVGSQLGRMSVVAIRPNAVIFSINEFGTNRRDSLVLRPDTTSQRPE
jgi:hypothetical protein